MRIKYKHILEIETLIRRNLDKRGMDHIHIEGALIKSAEELMISETVIIVTGFVVRDSLTGETDGPIGAVSLVNVLEKLKKNVVIVTDTYSESILRNACNVLGLNTPIEVAKHEGIDYFCKNILYRYAPTHIVAIERPGRASDGKCYSMRGEDLSDLVPNTDLLFKMAKNKNVTTLAIGDGGNELGMGLVKSKVEQTVENGEKICAVVGADHLLLAGVSNWGGHALGGALSIMSNENLLHDGEDEKNILESMLNAGAVDGCTKKCEPTVDGVSLESNVEMLTKIRSHVENGLVE